MTLSAEVQTRISAQLLVELTQQGDASATTIDTDVLDAAIADAGGEFLTQTGVAFDATNAQHIPVGVDGVMYYLNKYTGASTKRLEDLRTSWFRLMGAIATTSGAERRIAPSTSSTATPGTETSGRRPDHDRERWSSFVPGSPRADDPDEYVAD